MYIITWSETVRAIWLVRQYWLSKVFNNFMRGCSNKEIIVEKEIDLPAQQNWSERTLFYFKSLYTKQHMMV